MKHFFSFFFFLFCICCSAQIYVPSQYSTIQGAIDAAENGETIIVSSQITNYTGLIEINKELSIIAEGDAVIIDASEQGFAVKISADELTTSKLSHSICAIFSPPLVEFFIGVSGESVHLYLSIYRTTVQRWYDLKFFIRIILPIFCHTIFIVCP